MDIQKLQLFTLACYIRIAYCRINASFCSLRSYIYTYQDSRESYQGLGQYHFPDEKAKPKLVVKLYKHVLQPIQLIEYNILCSSLNSHQNTAGVQSVI